MDVLFALIETIVILGLLALAIKALAKKGILWALIPENNFAFVVTADSPGGRAELGGGGIEKVIHNVSGHYLDQSNPDRMKWRFILLPSNRRQKKGVLYELLGVQSLAPFRSLRTTIDRRFRYARSGGDESTPEAEAEKKSAGAEAPVGVYKIAQKDTMTRFIFFSGEEAVVVKNADTLGAFGLDFAFTFVWERTCPVRAMLRVADANAVLTNAAKRIVNRHTGKQEPDAFLGGENSSQLRDELIKALGGGKRTELADEGKAFIEDIEDALGLTITQVYLHDVDMEEEQRQFLELKEKTEREAEANLITAKNEAKKTILKAKGDKRARLLANEAQADHIEKNIVPLSQSELRVRIREAEAYENNSTVTTYAPGNDRISLIPGGKK